MALDLLQSGFRVAPEIKFVFIYDIMWVNDKYFGVWYVKCLGVALELFRKSSLYSYMTLCGVYGKCSGVAIDLLRKTSLCLYTTPELLQKSSLCSYMTSCGV